MSWWKRLFEIADRAKIQRTPQPTAQGKAAPTPPVVPTQNKTCAGLAKPKVNLMLPAATALDLGNGLQLELVLIPAGQFLMGKPDTEGYSNDAKQHMVTISTPFYMAKHTVTKEQYESLVGIDTTNSPSNDAKNPVKYVSWDDAQRFCKTLSATSGKTVRLPTEAEWEYACRAGSTTAYCFGDSEEGLADYAWYERNSDYKTHPPGLKKPNAWGLYDMHGNMYELCSDPWGKCEAGAVTDPQGPSSGFPGGVVRGGSSHSSADSCRSGFRYWTSCGGRDFVGFRVVVEAALNHKADSTPKTAQPPAQGDGAKRAAP